MSQQSYIKRFYKALSERDGTNCHYCEIQLIPKDIARGNLKYYEPLYDVDPQTQTETICGYTPRKEFGEATVDHIILKSLGGSNDLENLVLACWDCNTERNVKPYDVFLAQKRGES